MTVRPAIFSYGELASALSKDGRRVACAAAISNRAAAVSLKDRKWEDVCEILTSGLGISLQQKLDGVWLMDSSPEVRASERKNFDNWVAATDDTARSIVARAKEILPDWSHANLWAKGGQLREMAVAARDAEDDLTKSGAGLLVTMVGDHRIGPLFAWNFSEGEGIGCLVKHDCVAYGTGSTGNRSSFPAWATWPLIGEGNTVCFMDRLSLDPASGCIVFSDPRSVGPNEPDSPPFPGPVLADFGWLPSPLTAANVSDWRRMVVALPLGLSLALDTIVPLTAPSKSTAETMVRWSSLSHTDLVMEVSSARDELPADTRLGPDVTGKGILWNRGIGKQNLLNLLHPGANFMTLVSINELNREQALINLHPWQVSSVDDALVVTNRFSFLDHQFKLPFPNLFQLRSRCFVEDGLPAAIPMSALLNYCATTKLDENISVARNLPPLAPSTLGEFYPFGKLLLALSAEKMRGLLIQLRETGKATVPLAALAGRARDTFVHELQELALEVGDRFLQEPRQDYDAMVLHPDFDAGLKQMTFVVEFERGPSNTGTLTLALQSPISAPSTAPPGRLAEVRLENVSWSDYPGTLQASSSTYTVDDSYHYTDDGGWSNPSGRESSLPLEQNIVCSDPW